jgi:putative toxin-antitoxin system antitoxin component (TIGR02293 family)
MKQEHDKKRQSSGGETGGSKVYPDHGVVAYCLHETAVAAGYSTSKLVEAVEAGLPVEELETLRAGLDLPMEQLASRLGISKATLHRRKRTGRLEPDESGRVLRFARLAGKAVEVFETKENARHWLSSPQMGLGGAVPLDYAETELGAREVEDLLGRIEYGVYS